MAEFGTERVIDTAISEAAIAGAAVGAALRGLRPIAEIMYVDFLTIAMDQLVHVGAYNRYMFGGKAKVPMVLRTEGGVGRCIAAHHSESLEAWLMHPPGLYVVMPSTPYDAKGLLKAAIRSDNLVVFIEHKATYGQLGPVPAGRLHYPARRRRHKKTRQRRNNRQLQQNGNVVAAGGGNTGNPIRHRRRSNRPANAKANGHKDGGRVGSQDRPTYHRQRGFRLPAAQAER